MNIDKIRTEIGLGHRHAMIHQHTTVDTLHVWPLFILCNRIIITLNFISFFTIASNNSYQYMLTIYINIWPSIAVPTERLSAMIIRVCNKCSLYNYW